MTPRRLDDDQSEPAAEETPRFRTRWQVLPQWRDAAGNHHTDPTRWHTDQQGAWADFHTACRELTADRLGYTVDLIRSELARDGNGRWRPDGPARTIERWPGGMTTTNVRPNLKALANRLRMPLELSDPCTACQRPSTSYDSDGRPFCEGHLPRGVAS